MAKPRANGPLIYGLVSFFKLAMHNIFIIHYCDMFLRFYKIDKSWFYWGQLVFMIWNSVNDPLFGWISDRDVINGDASGKPSPSLRLRRIRSLRTSGFLLSITFALFWLDLPYSGPRFVISLCLYDTFLTMVDLHLNAVLVEFTVQSTDRAQYKTYASAFSILAACFVGASHMLYPHMHRLGVLAEISGGLKSSDEVHEDSSTEALWKFIAFCGCLGFVCAIGFILSLNYLEEDLQILGSEESKVKSKFIDIPLDDLEGGHPKSVTVSVTLRGKNDINSRPSSKSRLPRIGASTTSSKSNLPRIGGGSTPREDSSSSENETCFGSTYLVFLKSLIKNPNFVWMSIVNTIQCFHCHFNSSLFPVFVGVLLGNKISRFGSFILVFSTFVLPHFTNLIFLQLIPTLGLHLIVSLLLAVKFGLAFAMLQIGPGVIWGVAIYLAMNRVSTEGICRLMDLAIGDLADEDSILNKREFPVPAVIFGTISFIARAGQSAAPVFGFWVLSQFAAEEIPTDLTESEATIQLGLGEKIDSNDTQHTDSLKRVAFLLLVGVPMVAAMLQAVCWVKVTLKGQYLRRIKHDVMEANKNR